MRIAAISDVHGNVFALQRVLEAVRADDVDVLVNLGDHLSGGIDPAATAALLMNTPAITVRGNHDRQVLDLHPDQMGASDRLVHETISTEQRAGLASLPLTAEVTPAVLAFHGTPTNDSQYLLETVEPSGARPARIEEIEKRLNGIDSSYDLLLCGHTHIQRAVTLPDGTLIVNPGSVGYPAYKDDRPYEHVMEAGSPHARYAVLDDVSGHWALEFREVEYDWEAAAKLARRNKRPDVEHAVLTGTVATR